MRQLYFFLQLVNLSNEIKRAVRENHDKTVDFIYVPYRQSLLIAQSKE